jgi:heat shock protein HslJ
VLKNISSGNYTFTAVNTTLSPITVIINPKTLGFTGCNTFSIPYISINQGQFQIFGQVSSTQKQCKVNNDHKYLDVMRQADGYHHH